MHNVMAPRDMPSPMAMLELLRNASSQQTHIASAGAHRNTAPANHAVRDAKHAPLRRSRAVDPPPMCLAKNTKFDPLLQQAISEDLINCVRILLSVFVRRFSEPRYRTLFGLFW
jgi:hypothetical protein